MHAVGTNDGDKNLPHYLPRLRLGIRQKLLPDSVYGRRYNYAIILD